MTGRAPDPLVCDCSLGPSLRPVHPEDHGRPADPELGGHMGLEDSIAQVAVDYPQTARACREHRGDQLPLVIRDHLDTGHAFQGVSRPSHSLLDTP